MAASEETHRLRLTEPRRRPTQASVAPEGSSLSDSKEPQDGVDDSDDANHRSDHRQRQTYAHILTVTPRRPSATFRL